MIVVRRLMALSCFLALATGCAALQAQTESGRGLFARGTPTFGGQFTWSDEVIFRDWRIQKNALVGHYRLIDPNNRRQALGSYETCLAALEAAKKQHNLAPLPKHVVIVLHGLGAGRNFMDGLAEYLETEGGYYVVNFGYPSTMEEIGAYARSLDNVIRHLDGVQTIDFVAHSMGNIVVRRYLGDMARLTPAMRPPVKFQRMVMISPPNHGAEIADYANDHAIMQTLAEMFAGEPAKQLGPKQGWPEIEKTLVTPEFEFGIIAGGRGDDAGYLPQVPGDDDGLLSVATMKLAGASDFVQVHGIHQLMPKFKEVRELTLNFLKNGYFLAADQKQPIAAAAPAADPAAPPAAVSPTEETIATPAAGE